MSGIKHFKRAAAKFEAFGDMPGQAGIARLIGPELSKTMGVGLAAFDGCAIEWTVLYDEMIVVLEGLFRLRAGKEVFEGRPGDIIWIPEKTPIVYEGEKSVVCYALYPVDWRQRHGLA